MRDRVYYEEWTELFYDSGYGWTIINPRWCAFWIYWWKKLNGDEVRKMRGTW